MWTDTCLWIRTLAVKRSLIAGIALQRSWPPWPLPSGAPTVACLGLTALQRSSKASSALLREHRFDAAMPYLSEPAARARPSADARSPDDQPRTGEPAESSTFAQGRLAGDTRAYAVAEAPPSRQARCSWASASSGTTMPGGSTAVRSLSMTAAAAGRTEPLPAKGPAHAARRAVTRCSDR